MDQPKRRVPSNYGVLTNSTELLLSLALRRIMENEGMDLEIIVNPKVNDDGQAVVQVRELLLPVKQTRLQFNQRLILPCTARNCRRGCDQALQECAWHQRPAYSVLAGQVLLGPTPHQERHLLP